MYKTNQKKTIGITVGKLINNTDSKQKEIGFEGWEKIEEKNK